MARKRDFLVNVGGEMKTVAPSIITQTYEDGQWVGRTKPIVKGWQKINGAMVEVFDNDPSGPPYTKLTFEAYVGNDSIGQGGTPRVGYHAARRYAGNVRNDGPLGYLITTSVSKVMSATIGRIATSTGSGPENTYDSFVLFLNDRTVNADGSTTINWGVSDLTITFYPSNGAAQVASFDLEANAVREAPATAAGYPAKFGLLSLSTLKDFMPYLAEGRLKIEFNLKR